MPKSSPKEKIEQYFLKKERFVKCIGKDIVEFSEYACKGRKIKLGLVVEDEEILTISFGNYKIGTKIFNHIVDYYEEYAKEKEYQQIEFRDDRLSILQVLLNKGYLPTEHVEFWKKKILK